MTDAASSKLPHTGNKAFDVILVVILAVSALGIVVFVCSCVSNLLQGSFLSVFGNVMFALMYFSIIQYTATYFIQHKAASIYDMLFSYCMLTTVTTLTTPDIAEYGILLALALLVIVIVPLMRKDLTNVSRCVVILALVFALVAAITALKLYYGINVISTDSPASLIASVFSAFHLIFVWCIFTLLYVIRTISGVRDNIDAITERIQEIGVDAYREELREELQASLESEKAQKEQAKAEKKQKREDKRSKSE